jgi:hypothetical protein
LFLLEKKSESLQIPVLKGVVGTHHLIVKSHSSHGWHTKLIPSWLCDGLSNLHNDFNKAQEKCLKNPHLLLYKELVGLIPSIHVEPLETVTVILGKHLKTLHK